MSPGELLKQFLIAYIKESGLDESLLSDIPKKWEKYGDFVLFDERTFFNDIWKKQGTEFWLKIAEILKCKRIGLKNKIKNDKYRTPNVTILLGNDPWIVHKDNSITYTWNVEKSMFSAGNAHEKQRIGKLNCEKEVVVDLFAGIGYFTLPFLVHSKAVHVHACEWNPVAIEALKKNLVLNKVVNRCTIYEGDNQVVCPKKIGNRINLGLIPSSQNYWKTACEALVEQGGVLHIHENVETKKDKICTDCLAAGCHINLELCEKSILMNSKETVVKEGESNIYWKHKQWLLKGIHILHTLMTILIEMDQSKEWYCIVETVNLVKSYAPHISHLVYDVKIKSNNSN